MRQWFLIAVLSSTFAIASAAEGNDAALDEKALSVTSTSMHVEEGEKSRTLTSLGTIHNSSKFDVNEITIEATYFNGGGELIDTQSEMMYGLVAPASDAIAFRIMGTAARPAAEYASQKIRVTHAEPIRPPYTARKDSFLKSFILNALPFLIFVGVLAFFLYRTQRKGSAQHRSLELWARQVDIAATNAQAMERIANTLEHGVDRIPRN